MSHDHTSVKSELSKYLEDIDLPFRPLYMMPMLNPNFLVAPGAATSAERHHHDYSGGLVDHTFEVLRNCVSIAQQNPKIDKTVLYTAAVWHDFGKIFDYTRQVDQTGSVVAGDNWTKTPHYYKIYHISTSHSNFCCDASFHRHAIMGMPALNMYDEKCHHIEHCILSHHGRREWGSPVEPQTPEAWALHLSDMISARCLESHK